MNENINNNPEYSIKIQSFQYNLDAFLEKEENPFTFRNLTPNTKALTGSPDAIWHPLLGDNLLIPNFCFLAAALGIKVCSVHFLLVSHLTQRISNSRNILCDKVLKD